MKIGIIGYGEAIAFARTFGERREPVAIYDVLFENPVAKSGPGGARPRRRNSGGAEPSRP